jgi:hypothetical protein
MSADVLRLNILLNSTLVLRIGLSAKSPPHRIAPIRYRLFRKSQSSPAFDIGIFLPLSVTFKR